VTRVVTALTKILSAHQKS